MSYGWLAILTGILGYGLGALTCWLWLRWKLARVPIHFVRSTHIEVDPHAVLTRDAAVEPTRDPARVTKAKLYGRSPNARG